MVVVVVVVVAAVAVAVGLVTSSSTSIVNNIFIYQCHCCSDLYIYQYISISNQISHHHIIITVTLTFTLTNHAAVTVFPLRVLAASFSSTVAAPSFRSASMDSKVPSKKLRTSQRVGCSSNCWSRNVVKTYGISLYHIVIYIYC